MWYEDTILSQKVNIYNSAFDVAIGYQMYLHLGVNLKETWK